MNRHHLLWLGGGTSAALTAFAVLMLPQPPAGTDCSGPLTAAAIAEQRQLSTTMVAELQEKRSLTLADLCAIPDDKLQRAIARVQQPKPDHPGEAVRFRALQWQDEQGQIAENGLAEAHAFVQQLKRRPPPTAGLSRAQWQWQGPGNIGGRVRALLVHPDNAQKLWAGSVSGGIWTTEDGGASWAPVDDFMANLAVATTVMDPNNPDVMYAGTGEGFFNADAIRGAGIFKSTDAGVSWQQLASTGGVNFRHVNRLAVSANGLTLLAATNTGLFRSTNAGTTWSEVTPAAVSGADRFLDVRFHPSDSALVIAADDDVGVIYSTNGGQNWTLATGFTDPQRIEIAYAPSNPSIVYASLESGEVFRSSDGGHSFSLRSDVGHTGEQGWYDNLLWVDPTNADRLVVGGIDLWRSSNGGTSFSKFSTWWQSPASAHADQHIMIPHPDFNGTSNNTVFVGNDGGVYRIDNVFTALDDSGFTELNNNLGITQFYGVATAPDGKIAGGTQDNGHLVKQGDTESWVDTYGGDGGFAAVDPTDSDYVYGEYVYLEIHRSTDGGSEFSANQIASDEMLADNANFIAPFILDPNNPNTMLGGANQLWRTSNVKAFTPSWTSIKAATVSAEPISAIAVASGNSALIWVGHNNGEIYKTSNGSDGTPTWVRVGSAVLPSRYPTRIAIAPDNSNVVYIAYGGFSADNLYKSVDGGISWNSISSGLPAAPIRGIAIKPDRSSSLFIGTEVGVFASENAGASWGLPHDGPANVSVDELVWMNDTTLVAGTHGRGIYTATITEDDSPDAFSFTNQSGVAINSSIQSNAITVAGINVGAPISVSGGQYSIGCTASFTAAAGTISNGDTVCVRHTSSGSYLTAVSSTLTIGGVAASFQSTTKADNDPDSFSFALQSGVARSTVLVSSTATITGLAVPASISVSNGAYSIGCDGTFTQTSGTISNGQTVCVRHTSAATSNTSVVTILTIGGGAASFQSVTVASSSGGGSSGGGGGGGAVFLLPLCWLLGWRRQQRR